MSKYAIIVLACVMGAVSHSYASPANPEPVAVIQPDGSAFLGTIRGDEFQNWVETTDGSSVVVSERTGFWEYAREDPAGMPAPSGVAVVEGGVPPPFRKRIRPPKNTDFEKDFRRYLRKTRTGRMRVAAGVWDPVPVSGQKKFLLILVNFTDATLTTTADEWYDAILDTADGIKSVARYYLDNSFQDLVLVPAAHNQTGNPPGVITVGLEMPHPDYAGSFNYAMEKAWLGPALESAWDAVDFDELDGNSDGSLDPDELIIYFIPAGYEASGTTKRPSIWAHAWGSRATDPVYAGTKILSAWATSGELNNTSEMHPMGVIAHELGHQMCGLPDLYDTAQVNGAMGYFSLMATGSWGADTGEAGGTTPVNLDAWSRMYVGWCDPVAPLGDPQVLSLETPLSSPHEAVLLVDSLYSTTEYFLAENRWCTGWDRGLKRIGDDFSGGLLITHIDTTVGSPGANDINRWTESGHQGVLPVQAATTLCDMILSTCRGDQTTLFYAGNNNRFNPYSSPNSAFYDGSPSGFGLVDISEYGETMSFTYMKNMYRFIKVSSSPPGATIVPDPADEYGNGTSQTDFMRYYNPDTVVSLTAPDTHNGDDFMWWQVNGRVQPENPITIHLDDDYTLSAVYGYIPSLPYTEDFTDMSPRSPPEYWSFYSSDATNGRIAVSGGRLRMDVSSGAQYNLNEAVLTLALEDAAGVQLSFFQADSNDEETELPAFFNGHANGDGVAVSNDGTRWYTIVTAAELDSPGRTYYIDLDGKLSAVRTIDPSFGYTDTFKIKFQQYDNLPWDTDGREWDDIEVREVNTVLTHFEFDEIASPVTARSPFAVTITAKNSADERIMTYDGFAALSASNTDGAQIVEPVATTVFENGRWTGKMTLYEVGENTVLSAEDEDVSGSSNAFAVIAEQGCIPTGVDDTCDGVDDDCDGETDEHFEETPTLCGRGACASHGRLICSKGEIVDTCVGGSPEEEICDAVDNDCDGIVDNGGICLQNYYCDNDADTYYSRKPTDVCGTYKCIPEECNEKPGDDCDDDDLSVFPGAAEICENGIDEDCDGGDEVCECRSDEDCGPDRVCDEAAGYVCRRVFNVHLTTGGACEGTIIAAPQPYQSTVYQEGTSVLLFAVPENDSNCLFAGWGYDMGGFENPGTITIDNNKTVAALFSKVAEMDGGMKRISHIDPAGLPGTQNRPAEILYGMYDIRIEAEKNSGTAAVKIYLPGPAPAGYTWYTYTTKYGWIDFNSGTPSEGETQGAVFSADRKVVTVYVTDNGDYDDDPALRIIRNISGLGIACFDDDNCTDDGLFCNGPEVCIDHACVSLGDPCATTDAVCDEARATCTEETTTTTGSTGGGGGGGGGGSSRKPVLSLPHSIDLGFEKSQERFFIKNTSGYGALQWTIGDIQYMVGSGWITAVKHVSGATTDVSPVDVSVSRNGLDPGTYRADIPVSSNGGSGKVRISMKVAEEYYQPTPGLYVDNESIVFGWEDTVKTFTVENRGYETMAWGLQISYDNATGWLYTDADSGTLALGDGKTVKVGIDRQDLPEGVYTGVITVFTPGRFSQVRVRAGVPGMQGILDTDRGMKFFFRRDKTQDTLTLRNNGSEGFPWHIESIEYGWLTPSGDVGWLDTSPAEGYLEAHAEQKLTLSIKREKKMAAGFYVARITVSDHLGMKKKVWVIMRVPLTPVSAAE